MRVVDIILEISFIFMQCVFGMYIWIFICKVGKECSIIMMIYL